MLAVAFIIGAFAVVAVALWIDYDTERMRRERETQAWDRD